MVERHRFALPAIMRAVITMRLTGSVGFTNDNKSPIIHGRVIRATPDKENPQLRVRIHNIRSARPEPEIEILYAVYEDGDGKTESDRGGS